MTQTALKKELHKAIDNIDDESILKAVYTILNSRTTYSSFQLSDEDIRIIEERKASYKAGKSKGYTVKEIKAKVLKKLYK
jgi:hypothetical protein